MGHRVRLGPGSTPPSRLALLATARALGVSLSDAQRVLGGAHLLPVELPEQSAQALVATLLQEGLVAERVQTPDGGSRCSAHAALTADFRCEDCGGPCCRLCVLKHRWERCLSCQRQRARRNRFRNLRVAVLLLVLSAISLWGVADRHRRALRRDWARPLSVTVVLLSRQEVGEPERQAWSAGLLRLEGWLQQQKARYLPDGPAAAEFRLAGPVTISSLPFEPASSGWLDRARHALELSRALRAVDAQAQVDRSQTDARIYAVLEPRPESAPQWVEGMADANGEFGLVRATLGETELTLPLVAVTHELLHLVGATDKYGANGEALVPIGLAEPDREPLWPQAYAEVMVGVRPEQTGKGALPRSLEEVRVGPRTAQEVGWLPASDP